MQSYDLENHGFASNPEQAQAFLRQHPQITAIFAANDTSAQGVYEAASKLGRKIPDDLSVIGFADLPLASHLTPGLTTFRQDAYQLGCQAVDLMFKRLTGKLPADSPQSLYLPVELIQRESVRDLQQS